MRKSFFQQSVSLLPTIKVIIYTTYKCTTKQYAHKLHCPIRSRAQLHAHNYTHTHNNHNGHIQWHTTRLAAPHKCPTHATVASITVNSRPLKKPWQCIIYWSVQLGSKNGCMSFTVKQIMCSHWQATCSHMMAFHTALCMWTNGVQSTPHMWYCRSSLRQRANWSWWALM